MSWLQHPKIPHLLLTLLITLYALYFSWYTLNRHNTLNSYAADLSLIDQPMWNTARGPGGFMEQTWGERQQPRLAEHFEPILIPLATLFFLWDDVRILLIAQSLALALGALPIFWIARFHLNRSSQQPTLSTWGALVFALAYLLFPQLQAANVADFHADPFVVTPLLLAFWFATQQRWRWLWLWAGVALLTKENLPTLVAMLGLLLVLDHWQLKYLPAVSFGSPTRAKFWHGLALMGLSTTWFLIATFLIVAPLARHYFGTEGPIYLAHRFNSGLSLAELSRDPERWGYLAGLFAAFGFLPLLAPELLLLGAPVLIANLLSNFPGQYSGEQHYSAPLAVAFILAAIYGTGRLINASALYENNNRLKTTTLTCTCLWLAAWALGYHTLHGWTPLSIRTEIYTQQPAARQFPRLASQIPPQAVISASPGLHPHLAHRQIAYVFPMIQEAEYLLVDVTDISGVHPNDVRTQLIDLLNTDWLLLEADTGLILAQRSPPAEATDLPPCSNSRSLPCPFYDFAYPAAPPNTLTGLTFGDSRLRLLGYKVLDDPDDGVVFRFYWQAAGDLPPDLALWPLVYDDLGRLLSDPTQVPMITTVWYPPHAWPAGETIVTETLPQRLPDRFHLGLAVGPESGFGSPATYWPLTLEPGEKCLPHLENWVQLASFTRQGVFLTHLSPVSSFTPLQPAEAHFGPVQLTGFWLDPEAILPGHELPLLLQWQPDRPVPLDLTVFIHLTTPEGQRVAQSDTFPTWLTPQPTSRWQPHQPYLSRHNLPLPPDLPAGVYLLQLGLYNAQTLERLPLADGQDRLILTRIQIE